MSTGAWIWGAQAVLSGGSLVAGRPWTMLLSRRRYDADVRAHPLFMETNRVITGAWTLYFAAAWLGTVELGSWASLAFVAPSPVLGWASFQVGDRYASWKMGSTEREAGTESEGGTDMSTPTQAELRAQISDKSDDEIMAQVTGQPGGVEGVLNATVAGMVDALDPHAATDCVIGYEINGEGADFSYRIEVRGGHVQVEQRPPSDARVVLQLTVPEYLRLITGLLDGTEAFMSGRMKIRGDVMFAPQIGRMFVTA